MILKNIVGAMYATLIFVSFSINASVLNTLNGIDYEWLEVSETTGFSRDQIELKSSDSTDALYGYQYASRQLVKKLLFSYSSWDGRNGYHGDADVVAGMDRFMDDFGFVGASGGNGIDSAVPTVDGYTRFVDGSRGGRAAYGERNECGFNLSCSLIMSVQTNVAGDSLTAYQWVYAGWSTSTNIASAWTISDTSTSGAYLVKVSTVPIPSSISLFMLGLFGCLFLLGGKDKILI